MTIFEKINFKLNPSKYVFIKIFDKDKRVKTHLISLKDVIDNTFRIGEKTLIFDYKNMYYVGSTPILHYHFNNIEPVDFSKIEHYVLHNPEAVDIAINSRVERSILEASADEQKKLLNIIYINMALTVLVAGGIVFYLGSMIQQVIDFNNVNKSLFESLRDLILNGGFN